MYDKSKVWVKNAYANLDDAKKNGALDDAYFDIACFDAQQAIEFILKAILLEYGVAYATKGNEGHNILALFDLVKDSTTFTFEKSDDLEILATTITHWEIKGRYQTGIRTKEETVRRVLNIYKSIDESFSKVLMDRNSAAR